MRQIHETTLSYAEIRGFLGLIASSQGDQLNHSKIRKELGLSHATQKKLIYALEAVFLIRGIAIEGSTANTVYYLEDQAESVFLSPNQSDIELYEQFIYRNIRAEFNYQIGEDYKIFQFKTRGKARIPFCFSSAEGVIGVLPILENEPTRSHNASIQSFLRKYNNSKVVVVISDRTRQKKSYAVDDRVIVVSEVGVI